MTDDRLILLAIDAESGLRASRALRATLALLSSRVIPLIVEDETVAVAHVRGDLLSTVPYLTALAHAFAVGDQMSFTCEFANHVVFCLENVRLTLASREPSKVELEVIEGLLESCGLRSVEEFDESIVWLTSVLLPEE